MWEDRKAFEITFPAQQTAAVVFASPHSGNQYPPAFLSSSCLDPLTLQGSEDAFVDKLFASVAQQGAPLIQALFPRAFVDANRQPFELDPCMFSGPLPNYVTSYSQRLTAGLGTIPKSISRGQNIYDHLLDFSDIKQRIEETHFPYHEALNNLLIETRKSFGGCLLVDCHSMPSNANSGLADIVLGDGFEKTASPMIVDLFENEFQKRGYRVERNSPYAGGYSTLQYGKPETGIQALQIEINRNLYMDQKRIQPHSGFEDLAAHLKQIIKTICSIPPAELSVGERIGKAAE